MPAIRLGGSAGVGQVEQQFGPGPGSWLGDGAISGKIDHGRSAVPAPRLPIAQLGRPMPVFGQAVPLASRIIPTDRGAVPNVAAVVAVVCVPVPGIGIDILSVADLVPMYGPDVALVAVGIAVGGVPMDGFAAARRQLGHPGHTWDARRRPAPEGELRKEVLSCNGLRSFGFPGASVAWAFIKSN